MADIDYSILDMPSDSSSASDNVAAEPNDSPNTQEADIGTGSSTESATPPATDSSVGSTTVGSSDESYSEREKQLLARIEELSSRREVVDTAQSDTSFSPQEHNFLADLDLDEVLSTSEGLNSLLLAVYNKAIQESSRLSAEQIMRGLPGTMSNYFNQQISMRELVADFYKNNPELTGMKKTVAMVANEVANENPELTAEDVFKETAIRTKKLLGIADISQHSESRERPTLHSTRGNGGRQRIQVPELNGLAKEIHDLIT